MSSALAAASLILKPEGYSEGRLQTLKPIDRSGDFTFTRGSNLSATRVNSAGLIEKGRENLLTQSNQFDTTWATSSPATITGGQADKDGGTSAWKLEADVASTAYVRQFINTSSSVSTFSFYAKAGTANYTFVNCVSVTAFFDLANGVVGAISGGANVVDTSITSVAGGWYRVSLTGLGMTEQRIYTAPSNDNSVSAIGDNIYIQDAQLEAGMVATDYIETGASTVKAGILETTPRLDYSGGATEPSLLLEPSRTNVWEYSEYLEYSFASISGITTTQNTTETLSPEGLYNATKLEGVEFWSLRDFIAGTDAGTWTISCYIKAVNASSNNTFRLSVGGNNYTNNLTATSEWQRFDLTITNGGATAAGILRDTSGNDADLYIYGMQVEQGSYPTSYIPNHSGGSVTRGVDVCGDAGDVNTFNSTEGVLYTEIAALANDGTNRAIAISDGTTSNVVRFYYSTTDNRIVGNVKSVGTNSFNFNNVLTDSVNFIKIALRYKANDFKMYVNGVLVATDTSGNAPIGLNELSFDNGANNDDFYGKVKQVLTFNTALSDSDCITLTTL